MVQKADAARETHSNTHNRSGINKYRQMIFKKKKEVGVRNIKSPGYLRDAMTIEDPYVKF